jgi:hypothetical protein
MMAKKSTTFKGAPKPYGASGHFNEPRRHSLQARGIETGNLATLKTEELNLLLDHPITFGINPEEKAGRKFYAKLEAEEKKRSFLKDTDGDGVPDKYDCDPLDPTKQDTPKEIEKKVETERDYIKSLNKNWLSPDEQEILKKKMGGELTNEMRSQLEVHQFKQDPPERYFAYVNLDKKQITTWTGEKLGDITHVGNEWSSNMGDRRVPIRVKGINGFTYSGTFYKDAGDYARLKKVMGD